ncbi:hypothetical protein PHYC_00709 [Phycisphaerales bacterium]|nr:hypothetical protein PHYC_00709 [Phycisphaerales bacterium]
MRTGIPCVAARSAAGVALAGLSLAANAHIIYGTSFEPGQGMPGPLVGQDLWNGTPGWNVTNDSAHIGIHSITYSAASGPSGTQASRPTPHIQLDPILYWVALRLEAAVRLDTMRPDATSSFRLWAANEVPGGVLQIGVDDGRAVVTSGLDNAPLLVGPEIAPGSYAFIVAELDMFTGHVVAMVNDVPFGSFELSIPTIRALDSATGISVAASVSGGTGSPTETVHVDSVRLWHVPAPGIAGCFAAAALCLPRRRR